MFVWYVWRRQGETNLREHREPFLLTDIHKTIVREHFMAFLLTEIYSLRSV